MSIPLDRLYYYIENVAHEVQDDDIIIYHFYPHGSKNIENLIELYNDSTPTKIENSPRIICHDQEPLFFELYQNFTGNILPRRLGTDQPKYSRWNKSILLHSEQRSTEVEKYQDNNFIPVYYWSHAIIAKDWFRYAEYVKQKKKSSKLFLIYNRAWSGTREYRIGFADRLIMAGLVNHVLMRVSPVDSTLDKHYDLHQFKHTHWRPHNVIENHFPICTAESHYSADFDIDDYESTEIEVVLETLFDDLRLHLTEKTLRPIAMGQPFILAGTYGSLKYLHGYGFKTFADCWDESYDMMTDSIERMNKIVQIIEDITVMPKDKQKEILSRATDIAEYNKRHFFSDEFQTQIINELKNGLDNGLQQLTLKS
jgi:hypothetical protein